MSFFKPYQDTDRNKKVGHKAYPTFYRDPSALLLAGCPPAEPTSSWSRQIKNKKVLCINDIISVTEGRNNQGYRLSSVLCNSFMRLLTESAAYPFYLIVNIELQHLLKFTQNVTAYRRIANL